MAGAFVKKLTVRGQEFKVSVDFRGTFNTQLDGEDVESSTLAGLEEKLTKLTKKKQAKVAIEFVRWDEQKSELRRGKITGVHSVNGNLLIAWEGRKGVHQESSYRCRYGNNDYLRMTPAEASEYESLNKAAHSAAEAAEKFGKKFQFNPLDEIPGAKDADEDDDQ